MKSDESSRLLLIHILYGLISYVGIVYVLIKYSNAFDSGFLAGENLFLILSFLAAVSGYYVSEKVNRNVVLPLYHPAVLFFKIVFSKLSLLPALFFPLGALIGVVGLSVLQNKFVYAGTYRVAFGVFLILYIFGVVGALVNIIKLNRR